MREAAADRAVAGGGGADAGQTRQAGRRGPTARKRKIKIHRTKSGFCGMAGGRGSARDPFDLSSPYVKAGGGSTETMGLRTGLVDTAFIRPIHGRDPGAFN